MNAASKLPKEVRLAVWSAYCHGQGLLPSVLPKELQPMRLANALEILSPRRDDKALIRAYQVTVQLFSAANREVPTEVHDAFLWLSRLARSQGKTWDDRHSLGGSDEPALGLPVIPPDHDGPPMAPPPHDFPTHDAPEIRPPERGFFKPYARLLSAALPVSSAILDHFFDGVMEMLQHNPPTAPCTSPSCTVTIDPITNETNVKAKITIARTLTTLIPILDPRGWAGCSELFTATYAVNPATANPSTAIVFNKAPSSTNVVGSSWQGLLYEKATVGPQEVENILKVSFAPPATGGFAASALNVTYDLYRSISYKAGPLELPGMMRQNRGTLKGTAAGPYATTLEVTKTVKYARLSKWSGSRVIDYGDILNYAARALLAEWVNDVQVAVGCC